MTNDKELAEGFNIGDRLCQLLSTGSIHVRGRLIKEGNVNVCQGLLHCALEDEAIVR